jgi:epoxyqueuosine reductase
MAAHDGVPAIGATQGRAEHRHGHGDVDHGYQQMHDGEAVATLVERVKAAGRAAGLDSIGIAAAEPFASTRRDLERRKMAGLHAEMEFTYRNPARSTDPERTLPGVKAIVVGARAYPATRRQAVRSERGSRPLARVAAYAAEDHYALVRSALRVVADTLKGAGYRAQVVVDDNALVDREAAYRAGLGWYGKSSNLLLPGRGSWFVLGSVLTTAPLPPESRRLADGCGSCHRCVDGCPTGAIIEPGVVDARRCLSWLLQQPGEFPRDLRPVLGDRIYGCDDCQEVCPPNHRGGAPTAERLDGSGDPDASGSREDDGVDVLDLLAADDATLLQRFGRFYLYRREPRWLRRNALIVLGNVGDGRTPEVVAALDRYLDHPDPMLRTHAAWASRRLGLSDRLGLESRSRTDPAIASELAEPG